MKILVIDNTIEPESWGASELRAFATRATGATVHVRRAPHEDLPPDPLVFDRIVVSGSATSIEDEAPWTARLDEFILRAVNGGRPLLGVCYGHQRLARALGGRKAVRRAERGEHGWFRVELTGAESRLFRGLSRSFHTFQWHQDEVARLPPGARLLARSEACPIQAYELGHLPVFGIQFHPERGVEAGERSLGKKLRGHGPRLFDPRVGETIFGNFLALEGS